MVKLYYINRCGPVFFEIQCSTTVTVVITIACDIPSTATEAVSANANVADTALTGV